MSDEGTHFCNNVFTTLIAYGVHHKNSLAYHLQSNDQAKITNREIKIFLEKTVSINRKD